MSLPDVRRILKFDYWLLLSILALAFYIAFIPHLSYPYPVHIDEWAHLVRQETILKTGSITFVDPFLGESIMGFTSTFETGHNVFWSVFHQISGIPWMIIYRYFPGIILMLTVLSAYVLGRRQGFGYEAAFFTSLIPTTVGIMGPAFLVPVVLGLLFIPLALFVAFNFTGSWSYLTLFILTCALLTIHAATALGLALILAPYILLNLRSNWRHSLGIGLAVGIPLLTPFLVIPQALIPILKPLFSPQPLVFYVDLPRIIQTYGHLPIIFCLLGTSVLAIRGQNKDYGLVLGLLALLLMLTSFFTFHYGIQIMYYRGLLWMMVMMSIVAGAGLMGVKNFRLPERWSTRLKAPLITQNTGKLSCAILVVLTLVTVIPDRQDTPYYHMIDSEDYHTFIWIRDNVDDKYEKAILDPWKATAFTAITGKKVYTRTHGYPTDNDRKAWEFLEVDSADTTFLRQNGISIVYTESGTSNPDLAQVSKNVYLLKKAQ